MSFIDNKWNKDGKGWSRNEGLIDNLIPKRGKAEIKKDLGVGDAYKFYNSSIKPIRSMIENKETYGKYKMSRGKYGSILKDINRELIKLMILENFEYKIPYLLGTISLKQKLRKPEINKEGELNIKKLPIDYKSTKELWKENKEEREKKTLLFHTNEHSNGYTVSWWWSRKGKKATGLKPYRFEPSREMSRTPAKYLKNTDLKLAFYETPKKQKYMIDFNKYK